MTVSQNSLELGTLMGIHHRAGSLERSLEAQPGSRPHDECPGENLQIRRRLGGGSTTTPPDHPHRGRGGTEERMYE
jgi:hypothetical protein